MPGGLTPLLGSVPGTNGAPGRGATVEAGVDGSVPRGEVASAGEIGGAGAVVDGDGLKALGVLSFPQAVAVNPSTINKAIFR